MVRRPVFRRPADKRLQPFADQLYVIPSYSDLYSRKATERDLFRILERYPVGEWLSYLSRLQNLLDPLGVGNQERMGAAFQGVLSSDLRNRITRFATQRRLGTRLHLFYERQLATLQQLAILHGNESTTRTFTNEKGRHDLGRALLMTMDILDTGRRPRRTLQQKLRTMIQEQVRTSLVPAAQYAARAFSFYELDRTHRSKIVREYLSLYKQATGVNARDAIFGGIVTMIFEDVQTPKHLANAWTPIPEPNVCEALLQRRVLRASAAVRHASVAETRKLIRRIEGNRSIRDWNLIALSKSPVIKLLEPLGAFVLNHAALGRSLFDGVRHAILTAARENRLPAGYNNRKRVGGLYGQVFQSYVTRLLRAVFGDRLIRLPEADDEKRCDLLIRYSDKVVLVEIKGEHFIAFDHASYQSIDARREELKKIGVDRAVAQVGATIRALRRGAIKLPDTSNIDWTTTAIVPLIITEEKTAQVLEGWNSLYEDFDRPLEHLRHNGPLGRLRLLSLDELEMLPDLDLSVDFGALLYAWGHVEHYRDLTWASYLTTRSVGVRYEYVPQQFARVMQALATRLGLDPSKICIPPYKP